MSEIISALNGIEGFFKPLDDEIPNGNQFVRDFKTFIVYEPHDFDSGSIPKGIPIYSDEEQAHFPYRGGGESIETLAWYQSYHYGNSGWGIYILRSGIYKVANALISSGASPSDAISLAREFLIEHERTHFRTDLGVTSLELASSMSLFKPTRDYISHKSPDWHLVEEGLANSYGMRALKSQKRFLKNYLNSTPIGYRDYEQFKKINDLKAWISILDNFISGLRIKTLLAAEVSNNIAPKYFEQIPIYEVYDIPNGNPKYSYLIGSVTEILETVEFRKDLKKLCQGQPNYLKKWNGVKQKLIHGNFVGVHLELISRERSLYSIKLDSDARVGLRIDTKWNAIAARHHDQLYKRLSRLG